MSNTCEKPQNMKMHRERLDAVKALKTEIDNLHNQYESLKDELNQSIDSLAISSAELRKITNDLRVDLDERTESIKEEMYECIESYLVNATPRPTVDVSDITSKVDALEEKIDKLASSTSHTSSSKKLIRPSERLAKN